MATSMHWIALQSLPETQPSHHAQVPLADARSALAWWALQFTPQVARVDDALVLEVSASERLFGGLAALQAAIFKPNEPAAQVEYAQGATSLIARATSSMRLFDGVTRMAMVISTLGSANNNRKHRVYCG